VPSIDRTMFRPICPTTR